MTTERLLADWDRITASAPRPATAPRPVGRRETGTLARLAGGMAMVAILVAGITWILPRDGGRPAGGPVVSPSGVAEACLVTRPNGAHTDAWPASENDHGQGGLFTVLWPDGTVLVPPDGVDPDGVLWMKFVYQREGPAVGPMRIGGRRIGGAPGDPLDTLRATIPDGYGESGVQAVSLGFPRAGCWQVTAMAGDASLGFVTRVRPTHPDDLVGQPAPAIVGVGLNGATVTVQPGQGRPTIVDFSASWCPPCAEEQLGLRRLTATLDQAGVDLVTVLVRGRPDDDARFAVDHAIGGTIVRDADGAVLDTYAGAGLPMSVLVDADGTIHRFIAGALTAGELAAHLAEIVPTGPDPS